MGMGYDRIGNTQVRENGKKINLFDKVNRIKSGLKGLFPEIEGDRLLTMMSHCRRYYGGNLHYGRRDSNTKKPRDLTTNERIPYEYLLKENPNPSTTCRWFLATKVPEDIKQRLKNGKIPYKKALSTSAKIRRVKESNTGFLMMEEINNIVRSL